MNKIYYLAGRQVNGSKKDAVLLYKIEDDFVPFISNESFGELGKDFASRNNRGYQWKSGEPPIDGEVLRKGIEKRVISYYKASPDEVEEFRKGLESSLT